MGQQPQKKTKQTYTQKLQSKEKNDDSKSNQYSETDFSVEDKASNPKDGVLQHTSDGDKQSPTPPTDAVVADFYRNSARAKKLRAEAIRLKAEAIEDELRAWSLENGCEIIPSTSDGFQIEEDQSAAHLEGDHKKPKARRPYKRHGKVLKIEQTIEAKFPPFLEAEDEDDKMPSPDVLTMVAGWMNEATDIPPGAPGYSDRRARHYLDLLFPGWNQGRPRADC